MGKFQIPSTKWFDQLTTLSQVEGKIQNPNVHRATMDMGYLSTRFGPPTRGREVSFRMDTS